VIAHCLFATDAADTVDAVDAVDAVDTFDAVDAVESLGGLNFSLATYDSRWHISVTKRINSERLNHDTAFCALTLHVATMRDGRLH
jgi:hypothetical protein